MAKSQHTRGVIVPIGGAEQKTRQRPILNHFAELCGGEDGHIAVIPTASRLADTGHIYRSLFGDIGVGRVTVLDIADRKGGAESRWVDAIHKATGVFFTGGDQLLLSTVLGGTPVAEAIVARNAAGCHVAGTSAGAAFLSTHMIAFGDSGTTPRFGNVTLAPGLGLINRLVIDQHFRQRDRLGRLLSALSYNPSSIGMGLDEDTAAFIGPDDVIDIQGTGALTILDLSDLEYSAMADAAPGAPVDLVGVKLHVLSAGARYDLAKRTAIPHVRRLDVEEE